MRDVLKILASLAVVLAMLLGPYAAQAGHHGCDCPTDCAMHEHKLGCHSQQKLPCHGAGGSKIATAGCSHEAGGTSPQASWRALVPPSIEIRPLVIPRSTTLAVVRPPSAPVLEPVTPPPRLFSAVA